jgi:outer membrane protein TolC
MSRATEGRDVPRRAGALRCARLTAAALAAGASATIVGGGAARAAGGTMTIEQAVAQALESNPRLAAARARGSASHQTASSAAARMLPSVHLTEDLQRWNAPFFVGFAMGPTAPATLFLAREQTTNTFVASIDQPVLGLARLENERASQSAGAAAADAQVAAAEADVRQAVQTQFLRYFEAQALQHIADTSAHELGEQVTVAKARLLSGVITKADLLRIEVAVANAQQQALQARGQSATAYAVLMATIGIDARSEMAGVTLVEPSAMLAAARQPAPSFAALLPGARDRRPELRGQALVLRSAEKQATARGFALIPDLDVQAAYLRTDGQVFAPKNAAYVGLHAQWAIWEWGATEHLRRAAVAQATAAQRDVEATERQIEAELSSSLAEGDSALGAVVAAEKAIASAEEAFRVTQAQVNAGAATTTDLLEAQSALTQARLNLTRAQYELALARVNLARATGT